MSTEDDTSALSGFGADYQSVFIDAWSPCLGGILLVLVIVGLMIDGLFRGVFGGLKLRGDWFNNRIGCQACFPVMPGGWNWTFLISGACLLIWHAPVRYNESTERFTLF